MIVAYLGYIGARGTKFLGWHAAKKHTIAVPGRKGQFFRCIFESFEFEKIPYRQAAFMCVLNPALIFRTIESEKIAILGLACATAWFCSTISLDRSINCSSDAGTVSSLWLLDGINQRVDKPMPWIPKTEIEEWKIAIRDHQPYPLCHGEHHHH